MEHQAYEELLTLQALDALDASDQRELEAHLETCAACRTELAELRDAAGLLAHASTPAEPSAAVRTRLLETVRKEWKPKTSPTVLQFPPPRATSIWTTLLRVAAVIAFVALALGLIGFAISARHERAAYEYQTGLLKKQLEDEQQARRQDREVLALLASSESKKMELAGTQTAQNARAMFVFDQKSGRAVLMTNGLPAAPEGMAYEVWFIPKGHSPMPGKVFKVDPSGHAMMMDQMPSEAMDSAVIAITLEPEKGSASPTGAIYLSSPAT
jgi:anti-sigma-K factor RskA